MAVIGSQNGEFDYPDYYDSLYGVYTQIYWDGYGGQASWHKYMLEKFGRYYESVTAEQYENLCADERFQNMGSFPEEDCIQEIDGVWVVKLSN